ncbi:DNA polymerase III subunit chi [Pseudorhodoplanes sp.]|uniref:DNA polymerase III subunit chi n=1 Tax=Pseudorhodoplanes sp. TaxID=1934341 RepID=UPI002CC2E171|nr:DNA polymerase III subunit chi [Pseudorhodoplanes sp.]HWV52411.1 DNA polymerase III subunit chi [Pseudorhodoplanes sp.]
MTEVRFYHLIEQRLERVLPQLLEVSLQRGWRVVVQAGSDERVEALDAHLWTFRDDSFLPHGTARGPDAADQPVLLTADEGNANDATVRFLIDGVPLPADVSQYERLVLIFDGNDDELVARAREQWLQAKAQGCEASYWQPDDSGRWVQKA